MAFGRKKHKGIKVLMKFLFCLILIVIASGVGLRLYQTKIGAITKDYETQIETLKLDAYALKKQVYLSSTLVKAGTIINKDQFNLTEISTSIDQNLFISEQDFGKVLLIDVDKDTPLLKAMVKDEVIAKDIREEELSMFLLPSDLLESEFIDVRISFPNGEDYIVLSKKKVRDINLENNTLWLWLDEKEILTISSAIVDAYLHGGTKLYTVTYVAPTVQEEALPNYPVNLDVLSIIQSNPNILDEAKSGLTNDLRKLLDERLSKLSVEALASVENGVAEEENNRLTKITEDTQTEIGQEPIIIEGTEQQAEQPQTEVTEDNLEGEANNDETFY